MKKLSLKMLALVCMLSIVTSLFTGMAITTANADDSCFHTEIKEGIVKTEDGLTIARKCTACGAIIREIGKVDGSGKIPVYTSSEKSTQYTQNDLATGFTNIAEKFLYTNDTVLTTSGSPCWLIFDLKVKKNSTIASGDLNNLNNLAYKGFSIIQFMATSNTFNSELRLIADGWEEGSGASDQNVGTVDNKFEIKTFKTNNGYRFTPTVATVSLNTTATIAMRMYPATGDYDVYVDGFYQGSGTRDAYASTSVPKLRLGDDTFANNGGSMDITNIDFFIDEYTETPNTHVHDYKTKMNFYDDGVFYTATCFCGESGTITVDGDPINSIVKDGLPHVYNGKGNFEIGKSTDYVFVTDVTINDAEAEGNLITAGSTQIASLNNGYILNNGVSLFKVSELQTYQLAVKFSGDAYTLYINGTESATGTFGDASVITCGDNAFGHNVGFFYNKAVTLGATDTPAVPSYVADQYVKRCNHSDSKTSAEARVIRKGTDGELKYIYSCSKCGERVYSKLTGDLTNPNNDTAYANRTGKLLKNDFISVDMDNAQRVLYLENNVISANSTPYWVSFSVTPKSIAAPTTGDVNDTNGQIFKGYNMMSIEPSFFPSSNLRIMPDGWEKESGAEGTARGNTDGIAEVKLIAESYWSNIGADSVYYRNAPTVAYLKVGETTDFAIRVDAETGVYDVYVNGEYKASSTKEPVADNIPQIIFHDKDAGNYTYSNIRVAAESRDISKNVTPIELTAVMVRDNSAKLGKYTSLASIKRIGDSETKNLDLIFVENRSGKLMINTKDGMKYLSDKNGNGFVLSQDESSIAIIYNDINKTLRYYVNDLIAYADGTSTAELPIYDEKFAEIETVADIIKTTPEYVTSVNSYSVHERGTSRFIGFQEHNITGEIRLLSGVNMLWCDKVGYVIDCYDPNGIKNGDTFTIESDTVYSSVIADGKTVESDFYGFKFFSPLKVTDVTLSKHVGYFMMLTPFTEIGGVRSLGETVKILITENGYEYEKNFEAE